MTGTAVITNVYSEHRGGRNTPANVRKLKVMTKQACISAVNFFSFLLRCLSLKSIAHFLFYVELSAKQKHVFIYGVI